jgi:Spy/CpxP family protein refolding chaperone
MRTSRLFVVASSLVMLCLGTVSFAAEGGRGPGGFGLGGFGGGAGGGLLMLARMEAVQKEIKLTEDQIASLKKLGEEMRPSGDRANFRDMSQEQREKAFAEMRERMQKAQAKVAEILKPDQNARLEEIQLQSTLRFGGVAAALADAKVAKKLNLTDDQQAKLKEIGEASRKAMGELFQGGNRDGVREKMQELRKQAEEKTSTLLTPDQKAAFEKLKGAEFKFPEGGFGPPGGRGRGGERPQRPTT